VNRALLDEKVCIVSGAGPGTGRAIALAFAREGAKLVLACRNPENAAPIAAEVEALGRPVLVAACDVTQAEHRERLVAETVEAYGGVDVLVNNAFATGRVGPIESLDVARAWKAAFEVNVLGTMALAQAVLASMKARGGGAIVMIGTLASRKRQPGLGGYGASKAALLAATQQLASEVGRYGIRVNTVVPSHIDGPNLEAMFRMESQRRGVPEEAIRREVIAEGVLDHITTPEEVAHAVLFFASELASAITGQSLDVNGGQWFE
jgi:NAD(P)-dependent dehydrogenase (short-subunit alcohol dehydrogenase family)